MNSVYLHGLAKVQFLLANKPKPWNSQREGEGEGERELQRREGRHWK